MSTNLPPYSTFRTDLKGQQIMFPQAKSFGNVLTFTPPGFKQALNVKFPDSRLPVCVSCKRNFKTKDMCRVRNQHTRPPWTTAYICMTLDASCTDEDGKYVDKPFVVRMVQWRPYNVMEDFPPNSKTPVCATCKKTNRTRSFCRDRHKHRKLPWCTVYVMLSTQESADPSTVVAAPSRKIDPTKHTDEENNKGKIDYSSPSSKAKAKESATTPQIDKHQLSESTTQESNEQTSTAEKNKMSARDIPKRRSTTVGDDINDIPESRTMLIQINDEETTISWLDLSHEDDSTMTGVWAPQIAPQQPACIPTGTTLIQSVPARKYPFPSLAPTTGRVSKRDSEATTSIETSHDAYHQQILGGYTTAAAQPLAPSMQYPYPYHPITASLRKDSRTPPQYNGHIWPYPTASVPPQGPQNISNSNSYASAQQRPISPAPAINSPGGSMIGASSPSTSVTAGEAAAMRRKKPRREFEGEENPDSRHPHPSPPPPPPPVLPQLHHQTMTYGQVPLAPGPPQQPLPPPSIHQHPHPLHARGHVHQEQHSWIVYQQMYQAQFQPMKNPYTNDPSRTTVRTPESGSRNFHPHGESPNNVTMTPGPGDGGGDHYSDENDFDHQIYSEMRRNKN